jgi:hypothetical protein
MTLSVISQRFMGTDFIDRVPTLRFSVPHLDRPYFYNLAPSENLTDPMDGRRDDLSKSSRGA